MTRSSIRRGSPGPAVPATEGLPSLARGFTLIELLVVITIIAIVSAATLPVVLPALNHRQVSEASRILQAALVGARDAAIRDNAPRGIRLLADPVFNGTTNNTTMLAFNRFIPIETPGEYSTGLAKISLPIGTNFTAYVEAGANGAGPNGTTHPSTLRVDEELTLGNAGIIPNERTSWFWNIRIGDKIRLSPGGRLYTVVGPSVVANPERYVNDGPPGSPTQNTIGAVMVGSFTLTPEYLYLVNGQDDPGPGGTPAPDGYIDNGWDGYDNNYDSNHVIDDYFEWQMEQEQWVGSEITQLLLATPVIVNGVSTQSVSDIHYSILRRPTPSAGSREITLPGGIVIDATGWNSPNGAERSRLPIDPQTFYVDILINSNGQVVPTTAYSSPTAFSNLPFYHFWLTERQDVHELTDLWQGNVPSGVNFLLPMPASAYAQTTSTGAAILGTPPTLALKGERWLVSLFTRTGQLTSNSIENFNLLDINAPFYAAQTGAREAK